MKLSSSIMRIIYVFCFITLWFANTLVVQQSLITNTDNETNKLFENSDILDLKLCYSSKDLKKNKKDTIYMPSILKYRNGKVWDSINVRLIARGNFRFKTCYFKPLKVKIKKSDAKSTLFEGHKTLKIVLPCLEERDKNDNVVKEFLAYKFYETLTDYHFKTRLLDIEFDELKGKKTERHHIKGILIEDDKVVAKRMNGNVYKGFSHPLNQDDLDSVRNAFFQFMIGNTDFSTAYQHNEKLFFIDKKMIPVSYDFDMSGFVNCSYAIVSDVGKKSLQIRSVTERKYRGFKRKASVYEQVRSEYRSKASEILDILNNSESLFEDQKEFNTAKIFIESFFKILNNDKSYKNYILDNARTE